MFGRKTSATAPWLPAEKENPRAVSQVGGMPPHRCHLCGCSSPAVRCEQCSNLIFCLSCDDMYHRHPKRHSHVRKLVNVSSMPPPRPPPKLTNPHMAPIPPPRRKKPEHLQPAEKKPELPKKQFPLKFGSLKRFIPGNGIGRTPEAPPSHPQQINRAMENQQRVSAFSLNEHRPSKQFQQPLMQNQPPLWPQQQSATLNRFGYVDDKNAFDDSEDIGSPGSDHSSFSGSVSREEMWEPATRPLPRIPSPYHSQSPNAMADHRSHTMAGNGDRYPYARQNMMQHSSSVCDLSGQMIQQAPLGYSIPQHVQSMADLHLMHANGMMAQPLCGCRHEWIGPDAYGLWHPPVRCSIHSSAMELMPVDSQHYLPPAYRNSKPPVAAILANRAEYQYGQQPAATPSTLPPRPPSAAEQRFRREDGQSFQDEDRSTRVSRKSSHRRSSSKAGNGKNHRCCHNDHSENDPSSSEAEQSSHHHHHEYASSRKTKQRAPPGDHHHHHHQQEIGSETERDSHRKYSSSRKESIREPIPSGDQENHSQVTRVVREEPESSLWQCEHCTFLNVVGTKICAVCCKTAGITVETATPISADKPSESVAIPETEKFGKPVLPDADVSRSRDTASSPVVAVTSQKVDASSAQSANGIDRTLAMSENVKQQQHNKVEEKESGEKMAVKDSESVLLKNHTNKSSSMPIKKLLKDDGAYEDLDQKSMVNDKIKRIEVVEMPKSDANKKVASHSSQQTDCNEIVGNADANHVNSSAENSRVIKRNEHNSSMDNGVQTLENNYKSRIVPVPSQNSKTTPQKATPKVASKGTSPPPQSISTQTSRNGSPEPLEHVAYPTTTTSALLHRASSRLSLAGEPPSETPSSYYRHNNNNTNHYHHHHQAGHLKRAASLHFGGGGGSIVDSPWAPARRDSQMSRTPSCASLAGDYHYRGVAPSPPSRDEDSPPRNISSEMEQSNNRRYSVTSRFGQREDRNVGLQRKSRKDYYLSLEELVEKRHQETIKAQGLELVRLLREAEKHNFTADDLQVAMNHCGAQNPLLWLQDNWRNMLETVVTLATNYGHDKKENDIGIISNAEAKECLRMHKGNIWAAVTECVEQRQLKFAEIQKHGNFSREEVVAALTSNQGNVNSALDDLNKSTLKPFLMRIWGPPVGVENEAGVSWDKLNPLSSRRTSSSASSRERDRQSTKAINSSFFDIPTAKYNFSNISPVFLNRQYDLRQQERADREQYDDSISNQESDDELNFVPDDDDDELLAAELPNVDYISQNVEHAMESANIESAYDLSDTSSDFFNEAKVAVASGSDGREDIYYDAIADVTETSEMLENKTPSYNIATNNAPENSIPSYKTSENSILSYKTPENSIPSYKTPENSIPSYKAPENSIPSYKAPENSIFPNTTHENNIFPNKTPENSIPSYKTPENSIPSYKAPENSIPSYKAPENSIFPNTTHENNIFPNKTPENNVFPSKTPENNVFSDKTLENSIFVNKTPENVKSTKNTIDNNYKPSVEIKSHSANQFPLKSSSTLNLASLNLSPINQFMTTQVTQLDQTQTFLEQKLNNQIAVNQIPEKKAFANQINRNVFSQEQNVQSFEKLTDQLETGTTVLTATSNFNRIKDVPTFSNSFSIQLNSSPHPNKNASLIATMNNLHNEVTQSVENLHNKVTNSVENLHGQTNSYNLTHGVTELPLTSKSTQSFANTSFSQTNNFPDTVTYAKETAQMQSERLTSEVAELPALSIVTQSLSPFAQSDDVYSPKETDDASSEAGSTSGMSPSFVTDETAVENYFEAESEMKQITDNSETIPTNYSQPTQYYTVDATEQIESSTQETGEILESLGGKSEQFVLVATVESISSEHSRNESPVGNAESVSKQDELKGEMLPSVAVNNYVQPIYGISHASPTIEEGIKTENGEAHNGIHPPESSAPLVGRQLDTPRDILPNSTPLSDPTREHQIMSDNLSIVSSGNSIEIANISQSNGSIEGVTLSDEQPEDKQENILSETVNNKNQSDDSIRPIPLTNEQPEIQSERTLIENVNQTSRSDISNEQAPLSNGQSRINDGMNSFEAVEQTNQNGNSSTEQVPLSHKHTEVAASKNTNIAFPNSNEAISKTVQSDSSKETSSIIQHPLLSKVQTTFSATSKLGSKTVMVPTKENDLNRLVRKLLAEEKLSNYEQAEVAAKLIDLKFDEDDAIYAAMECSDLYMAVSYLQQDCELCAGRFPMGRMTSMLNCVHRCCFTCAKDYFTLKIKEGSILDAVCPFCSEPNLRDENAAPDYFNNLDILLKNLVTKDVHELYQRKLRDMALMNDPNFRWCNKCSSGFIADLNRRRLICPDCRDVTCAECKLPWEKQHEGTTCAQFSEWKKLNDPKHQIIGLEKYLSENGIDCPNCKFKYSLAKGGCMHFTCSQCRYEFCSGCGKPFLMAKKCGLTERCEKLGLHAHHPRNCLFYLRDKEPKSLQELLDKNGVHYDTETSSELQDSSRRTCPVMEQREFADGNRDAKCDREVEDGHAGLCILHYVEYLVTLVNKHRLDPAFIMDVGGLQQEIMRQDRFVLKWEEGELQEEYKERLVQQYDFHPPVALWCNLYVIAELPLK